MLTTSIWRVLRGALRIRRLLTTGSLFRDQVGELSTPSRTCGGVLVYRAGSRPGRRRDRPNPRLRGSFRPAGSGARALDSEPRISGDRGQPFQALVWFTPPVRQGSARGPRPAAGPSTGSVGYAQRILRRMLERHRRSALVGPPEVIRDGLEAEAAGPNDSIQGRATKDDLWPQPEVAAVSRDQRKIPSRAARSAISCMLLLGGYLVQRIEHSSFKLQKLRRSPHPTTWGLEFPMY